MGKSRQTDFKRLIKQYHVTGEGELASKVALAIDEKKILDEAAYDGFYAVCTNLEDDASEIARINKMRWKVEECFRIMKSDLKARPVYLKRDDRIKAFQRFPSVVNLRLMTGNVHIGAQGIDHHDLVATLNTSFDQATS